MTIKSCQGLCQDSRYMKKHDVRHSDKDSWYMGYFRCRHCEIYIKDGTTYCFCCSRRLAIRPRCAKSRRMLVEKLNIKRYEV